MFYCHHFNIASFILRLVLRFKRCFLFKLKNLLELTELDILTITFLFKECHLKWIWICNIFLFFFFDRILSSTWFKPVGSLKSGKLPSKLFNPKKIRKMMTQHKLFESSEMSLTFFSLHKTTNFKFALQQFIFQINKNIFNSIFVCQQRSNV